MRSPPYANETDTTAPYSYDWTDVSAGTYSITAVATDNNNATTTSAAVNITVGAAPVGKQVYYIHTDHLNTPRLIEDQNQATVWQWDNDDPFGNNIPSADPNNTGTAFVYNHRFPGQYYDVETQTHYNYFRDYDPSTGRYLQSDPIGLAGGINTYGYVEGNPLLYTDPAGLCPFCAIPGGAGSGALGSGLGVGAGLQGQGGSSGNGMSTGNPALDAALGVDGSSSSTSASSSSSEVQFDKAGLKVSPKSCTPPPGGCSPYEHRRLQDEVNRSCKRPRACRGGMLKVTLYIRRENSRECALARDKINRRCFSGGDKDHRDAAISAWEGVAKCEKFLR